MARTPRRSRAGIDLREGQAGDVTTGDSAGGDIYHNDPRAWLEFIRQQLWQSEEQRDIRHKELLDRMERQEDALKLHEIAEERRRSAEDGVRKERQEKLDADLAAIRAEAARLRLAITGLAILIIVAFGLLALLFYERSLAATVLRYWLGGAIGLAALLRR